MYDNLLNARICKVQVRHWDLELSRSCEAGVGGGCFYRQIKTISRCAPNAKFICHTAMKIKIIK